MRKIDRADQLDSQERRERLREEKKERLLRTGVKSTSVEPTDWLPPDPSTV